MNLNSCSSCNPAPVHISYLWCGHNFFKKKQQKICKIFNICFQTQKQPIKSFYVPQLSFSCCFCPLSQRGVFPPAASAITSGVTRLRESFQATSSQTAEAQLEATAAPAYRLWVHSAAGRHTRSLNIAHAAPGYKRRNISGCFGVLGLVYILYHL